MCTEYREYRNLPRRPGDSFIAGDVLLEIETDKAQMDVEAQEDGKMAKIIVQDGAKAIKVGDRIAVLAEEGDDLASLELPAEDKAASSGQSASQDRPSPQDELSGGLDKKESSPSSLESPPSSKPNVDTAAGSAATAKSDSKGAGNKAGKPQKQKYPLYPSVQHLLLANGLTKDDANKIPATGPLGRLLKGDVLAYMGRIEKNYSAEQSRRIEHMGHLDLSNIQLSTPKNANDKKAPAAVEAAKPAPPADTQVALPITLTAVLATQKRVQESLGIHLPLSTFIARASELANEDLPLSKHRVPTSEELFNSVLGLDKVGTKTSRGNYTPHITGLPATSSVSQKHAAKKSDIIDLLSAKSAAPRIASRSISGASSAIAPNSVFSVTASRGEERRVQQYLERMKLVLEAEPGRLVL